MALTEMGLKTGLSAHTLRRRDHRVAIGVALVDEGAPTQYLPDFDTGKFLSLFNRKRLPIGNVFMPSSGAM
jgi:hypothetical protein